jgi:YD repeat-containing protein
MAMYNTAYDSHGNPTSFTQIGFGTLTAAYTYDGNGRILIKTTTGAPPMGTQAATFVYAADGSYTVTSTPSGSGPNPSYTATYDAKDNLLSSSFKDSGGTTTMSSTYAYTFDTNGNPSSAVATSISSGQTQIATILYDWTRL